MTDVEVEGSEVETETEVEGEVIDDEGGGESKGGIAPELDVNTRPLDQFPPLIFLN